MTTELKRIDDFPKRTRECLKSLGFSQVDQLGGIEGALALFAASLEMALPPEGREQERDAIIEECAKVCEQIPVKWLEGGGVYGVPVVLQNGDADYAAAIRALKRHGPQEESRSDK